MIWAKFEDPWSPLVSDLVDSTKIMSNQGATRTEETIRLGGMMTTRMWEILRIK